ncbi:MAG TPA: protein kinase [Polyangiaceae bacterium]|nr:protein kinase [Polyangiaceae bacterium]
MATNPGADASELELVSRWLGKTIKEKYVVESMIGSGGMAVVYSARHHRNGKRFAVKMLHRELSLNTFIRQRFLREGYVANRVDHPGAVAVIDDDVTEDGSAFLVMELLIGTTVESLWEGMGHQLPLDCTLAVAEQLLDVLTAAHAQSIVHRDLKPANMFLARDGSVKILDFGIARLRESTDSSKTESGTTLGTPLFMPPEQASGRSRDVDGRTDLWAVGATMFSLLSGQYVHDGENATQVLISAATSQARSLTTAVVSPHPVIVALIDKALAFDSDDRWESAAAMRAAVTDAYQTVFGTPMSRDILKTYVREATGRTSSGDAPSKVSGAISAVSGVAPTMQTPTPSGQPPATATNGGPRNPGQKRVPSQPTRPTPSRTAPLRTPANVVAVAATTKESPAPAPSRSRALPIAAGLATLVFAAGGLWVAHSRTAATAPIAPEPVATTTAAPNTATINPAATAAGVAPVQAPVAPTPPPTVALTEVAPEHPTATPAANAKHAGAPKTPKPTAAQPTPVAAQPEAPPPAAVTPPPPVAAKPDAPAKTPVIDRGNPFN